MNKLLLNLVMLLSPLWRAQGADIVQLKAILEAKLLMDDRRPMSIGRSNTKPKGKWGSVIQVIVFAFIGVLYTLPLAFTRQDLLFGLTAFYCMFLFYLWFSMVIGFSSVLVDTRDNLVLLPRPISNQTLLLSRLLHIAIYLLRMVVPMSLSGWVWMGWFYGWKAVMFYPFPLLLLVFLTLFLVNGAYLVMIRLAGPARFKDVLSTFQIAFSIVLFASYYILPRQIDAEHILNVTIAQYPAAAALPSYWLAATWTWIIQTNVQLPGTLAYSMLAVIAPVSMLWLMVKWLAPRFVQAISQGTTEGQPLPVNRATNTTKGRAPLYLRLAKWLNKHPEAQAGFMVAWLHAGRSRSFKMKIYPSLAYIPIYFVFIIMSNSKNVSMDIWMARMAEPRAWLILLYMGSFAIIQLHSQIYVSDQFKAAWVYHAAPVSRPGNVMAGAFKAVYTRFYLPFALLISLPIALLAGWKSVPDITMTQVCLILFALLASRLGIRALPFSLKDEMKERGSRPILTMFALFLSMPLIAGGHFLAIKFWWLKFIFYPMVLILGWMLWDSFKKVSWQAIRREDGDE